MRSSGYREAMAKLLGNCGEISRSAPAPDRSVLVRQAGLAQAGSDALPRARLEGRRVVDPANSEPRMRFQQFAASAPCLILATAINQCSNQLAQPPPTAWLLAKATPGQRHRLVVARGDEMRGANADLGHIAHRIARVSRSKCSNFSIAASGRSR